MTPQVECLTNREFYSLSGPEFQQEVGTLAQPRLTSDRLDSRRAAASERGAALSTHGGALEQRIKDRVVGRLQQHNQHKCHKGASQQTNR